MAIQSTMLRPFLKWAGGKRQLLPEIRNHLPATFNAYFEPFLGAGAVLFDLQPKRALVNDINSELVNTYNVVRTEVESLIADLALHENKREYYYQLRDVDRQPEFAAFSSVSRASRMIYLNKTCYNGLFRVNRHGQFNVPFGNYTNPKIVNHQLLRAVHHYLAHNDITLLNGDFESALVSATKGDFVYLDPPYDPVSETASFTSYDLHGFKRNQQQRLKQVFDDLSQRGCQVLLSNSDTAFIRNLYRDYTVVTISANRAINSDGEKRGKVNELLVMNYV